MRNAVLIGGFGRTGIEYPVSMSRLLEGTSVITRGEGWLSAWVGEEHVMMSAETGTCVTLSETGGRIWELIEEPIALDHLCDLLSEEYDASKASLRPEVISFLESMQQQLAVTIG